MLTRNEITFIKSLQSKKNRWEHNLFIAEGSRIVLDILSSIPDRVFQIYATSEWVEANQFNLTIFRSKILIISKLQLQQIASLKSTEEVIGVFNIKEMFPTIKNPPSLSLFLYDINDPGNLGSLVRTADWFGIDTLYASKNTVDEFNNKVIQASMSSIVRVQVIRIDFEELLDQFNSYQFLAADSKGFTYKQIDISTDKIICLGNESHGLPASIINSCTHCIQIPGENRLGAESLNVAIAGSILLSYFAK
ncbi:MAG: RNA methyltransferase [Bacteroidota bacterium]|nr:RNA methyltransferase [Bacteroidota bacterium]